MAGKDLATIAATLGVEPIEAANLVKTHLAQLRLLGMEDREAAIQLQLSRLDYVIANAWAIMDGGGETQYDRNGDEIGVDFKNVLAAQKNVMQAVKQQSELMGILGIDQTNAQATVLVVGGETQSYVDKLKTVIESGEVKSSRE